MPTADEVIVEFEARVGQYEADLRRSAATFERVTQAQQRQMIALERQISASSGKIGSALKGLTALFGAQQVVNLSDSYTRLQNSLKVAGLEGENLADVQARLLDLGGKYGVSVNTLADLYGNLSQVGKDLGASQAQILRINEAVSQSLIVTGKSSAEASGAVLGLVQAFGNGKLQAEEFAQINEGGLRPLLEAAAASDKFGGSVQNLRKAVYDGKVTSQDFFQAILDGADTLESKAANATLTLEGAFTALNNRLIEYVGSAASSSGASGALAAGIQLLGDNLDTVSKALAVITAIVGVRYVGASVAATTSTIALAAANTRAALTAGALSSATYKANVALLGERAAADIASASISRLAVVQGTAARAGSALLAGIGGPIGAAVLALGAGIAVLAGREAELEAASESLSQSIEAQSAEFEELRRKKTQAAAETNNLSAAQRSAITDTANLTGEANLLANAWARVAAEAKNAAIAQARSKYLTAQINFSDAEDRAKRVSQQSPINLLGRNNLSPLDRARGILNSILDPSDKRRQAESAKAQTELDAARENLADAFSQFQKVTMQSLKEFKQDPIKPATDPDKKKADSKKKPSSDREAEQAEREVARLRLEELQARLDLATTAEDRADLQDQILMEEKNQRIREAKGNKDALAAIERLYGASPPDSGDIVVSRGLLGKKADRDRAQQLAREDQDIADEQSRVEQDILRNQYDLADSSAERKRLALASIDLEDRYQRAQLQAIINLEGASSAAGKRAQVALDAQAEITAGRRAVASRSNQSPLEAYRDRLDRDSGETKDVVESYVVDELNMVRDSISGAIQKRLGVKDPLIAGLLNMFIEDVIMKPIAEALQGASSGSGGLFGSLVKFGASLFGGGRAIGGPVKAGVPYLVGENGGPGGRELFVPQQSGVIVPNHRLSGNRGGTTVISAPRFDLAGAVITAELYADMQRISDQSAARAGAQSYQQSMRDAPGAVRRAQRFRTT